MKILYDGKIYEMQVNGGINRYFASLIRRLPQDYKPTLISCCIREQNYPAHPNLETIYFQRFAFKPGRVALQVEPYYLRAASRLKSFDLIHPTYYSLLTRQNISKCKLPIVLTVHDMIHEIFYPGHPHIEMKRRAILAAQVIICVSKNTKQDLLERYAIPEEKVTVTYLASGINVHSSYGDECVPSQPYCLYVGHRGSYKNFNGLLQAFAKVTSVNSEVVLCVVGTAFDSTEQALIAELNLETRIVLYEHISDRHLAKLYRCSLALVYPSFYEGFGIPPLEAMQCQTAVIASNTSSIPEVVGDAGLLFDPTSVSELADRMLFLLDHPSERDRLIAKGQARAALFSWDKTVSKTLDVYRSVVN